MSLTICLSPEDFERRLTASGLEVHFTAAEKIAYRTTPVVERPFRVFGFPTPAANNALTLGNLKRIFGIDPARPPSFFEHHWYADETFMHTPCKPGWHFLGMDVRPDSIHQAADYFGSLAPDGSHAPQAVEVILMLFLHYHATREQLLMKKHTWCNDSASLGRQVTVGAFGRNGVFISGHPPNYSSRGLGICPAIDVSPNALPEPGSRS